MYKIMRIPEKGKVADAQSMDATFNGPARKIDFSEGFSICCSVTDATPADGATFISGTAAAETLTFPAQAASTGGDYVAFYTSDGARWAAALNKSGADAAPTGPIWTAIPAGHKTNVDISGATTAASVATLVKTALNLLTGFTALATADDSAADGTLLVTEILRNGPLTAVAVPKTKTDGASGSITTASTAAGVAATVEPTTDTITVTAHGMNTGLKIRLTTSVTLPAGLSTGVDYYVIKLTADTFQLATSLANSLIPTPIDITDYGTGTHTVDVRDALAGALSLEASNNAFADRTNNEARADAVWTAIPSTSVTLTGGSTTVFWNVGDAYYEAVRIVWTRTAGQGSLLEYFVAKGNG